MGRKSLITVGLLLFATLQIAAQSGTGSFEFTENKGQWDKKIRFKSQLGAGAISLEKNGFTVLQQHPGDLAAAYESIHAGGHGAGPHQPHTREGNLKNFPQPVAGSNKPKVRGHVYHVSFEGSNNNIEIVPDKPVPGVSNYFLGNDPSKWATGVKTYQALIYKNVYPNVDIRYYADNGTLKYDIVLHPGADVNNIALKYDGVEKLSVKNQELVVKTSVGDVRELYPYSYQFDAMKGKQEVECKYEIVGKNTVKFKVKNYSKTSTLIIDPVVVFCTFTGSKASEFGFTATPGPDGSLYSGSIVFGPGFPTSPGAYDDTWAGSGETVDVGIFRFASTNSQRIFATYLGGGDKDFPHSLICDPQGNVVVMGRTYSGDFPGTKIGPAGGSDIFVTKIKADGTGPLIGSLRIGGSANDGLNIKDMQNGAQLGAESTLRFYGDDSRSEVILDGAGNIYVAAQTRSGDFPQTTGHFQEDIGGGQDGIILKINPTCTNLLWASYLGGTGDDGAFVLALKPGSNDIYVAGTTLSNNFPGDYAGVYQPNHQPGNAADGYIAVISNDGNTHIKSTYVGTNSFDGIYGIRFDKFGYPYIMGIAGDKAAINATFVNPGAKQFVGKLKQDLSGFEYYTTWGASASNPNISPVAFLVDRCENIYISGWGGWIQDRPADPFGMSGPAGMPITPDAEKSTTDGKDFYFIVIQKNAAALLYGSFFGQNGGEGEHVDGGTSRFDEQGVIYQAICANCGGNNGVTRPFPTSPNAWSPNNGSSGCNLAVVKLQFNFIGVSAGPKAYFEGVPDTMGCVPFTVTFRDTVRNAKTYEWDFDGAEPSDLITTNFEVTHTFTAVGNYRVRLIAVDSNTCNIRDTQYVNIRVRDDEALLNFDRRKVGDCNSLTFEFINTSTPPPGKPFKANSFVWNMGDGSPEVTRGPETFTHTFPAPGPYNVRLMLVDTNYCNAPDDTLRIVRIAANVVAQFETPPTGCAPYDAVFNNTSLGGHDFEWDFGDGSTSTEEFPVHHYATPGTYVIKLTAYDTTTCNKVDDTTMTIVVNPKPSAAFTYSPTVPQTNKPIVFTNQSTGGVRYKWLFGDGEETTTNTMESVSHQYNATGKYEVLLVTYNQYDCTDTARAFVDALISPLLDVPNAFTPGRFGKNSSIKVEGYGINKMTWRIYNRIGQLVFEGNDRRAAWDGTYKGKVQPMDVYAYTLEVEFVDGTKVRRTGDITLIR